MTVIFPCGAIGSWLGSLTYVQGGWRRTATVGAAMAASMFLVFLSQMREPDPAGAPTSE